MTGGPAPVLAAPGRPPATGSRPSAAPRGWGWRVGFHLAATSVLLMAAVAGVSLTGGGVTLAAAAALLVLGLPHGSFDMLVIAGDPGDRWSARAGRLLLYLSLGGATAMLWWVAPGVALAAFLLVGVIHFAEDWQAAGSTFIAQGIALALIAAPGLLHGRDLAELLAVVATPFAGELTRAALTAVAPVAIAVALVGFTMVARQGARGQAASGIVALAGMIALPPLIGFALFFCLLHSPLNFAQARGEFGRDGVRRWAPVVMPVTLLALGMAGGVWLLGSGAALSSALVRVSFRTLSILTVPHVVVPAVLRRWRSALPPALREGRG